MQRYFIDNEDFFIEYAFIKNQDAHHIRNVMRMQKNDEVSIIVDSCEYLSRIENIEKEQIKVMITKKIENSNELNTNITIAHGLVKKDKMEQVVKTISELGAYAYYPVIMKRSTVTLDKNKEFKMDRCKLISKEAAELSRRVEMTKVFQPISFEQILSKSVFFDLCLVAYENEDKQNSLDIVLKSFKSKNVLVIVGPEGGIDQSEIDVLMERNFKKISLGKRILSTITAPIAVTSILAYYFELGITNEN